MIAESDLGFDRLAERLSELYLVNSDSNQQGAVIHMDRYFAPCRHHTVVIDPPAWHKDVITAMYEVLQGLPDGWTFGIDATEFPPGQAYIVVTQSGDVYGWSEFRARHTLVSFGFERGSPLLLACHLVLGSLEAVRRAWRVRRLRKILKNKAKSDDHL
ncbi:MAG: hypothetical protein CFE26_18365 [Verrucomicrobiales bacterium VVV1]|nr:MAG: hypothetical protein CFE26_18365 [Verrucomicrobiales bacterium VVV1]